MSLSKISNEELLAEIQSRFEQRDNIIQDSKVMLKKLEEINKKLTKSEENRSKFMSIIKNEFNNPLFSMLSLSKTLLKSSNDEKIQMIGHSLYEESLMLNFQIKNVITAAEIESGTVDIQVSKIDFYELMQQIKEDLQYSIRNKNIDLKVNILCCENLYLDREKIYIVLINLISNAIEFSPSNLKVTVLISNDENSLEISVLDSGEGIQESEKENIFKRFYQAHSGMNRIHRGQGLGLSVVKDVIDMLNGSIEFLSVPNIETIFNVKVPLSDKGESLFDDDDFMFDVDDSKAF